MTNSQRRQMAELFKQREQELLVELCEGLLEAVDALLELPVEEAAKQMAELRDALKEAKAEGWKCAEKGIQL